MFPEDLRKICLDLQLNFISCCPFSVILCRARALVIYIPSTKASEAVPILDRLKPPDLSWIVVIVSATGKKFL